MVFDLSLSCKPRFFMSAQNSFAYEVAVPPSAPGAAQLPGAAPAGQFAGGSSPEAASAMTACPSTAATAIVRPASLAIPASGPLGGHVAARPALADRIGVQQH
mmetsp:Transcript_24604/g.62447  ORF Transcript_24604/g.62447 Transcript_24604/m.62447 type:complete len:103 (+) Transcript_24604:427-735(+)